MAEIVNLNRFRKAKVRADAAAQADANRAKFGRSKAEKAADALEDKRRRDLLDGARRDDD
ncbi:hypothetical protein ASE86_02155 [Sphingomonas sp. Leaf33]|uniref:DUF4169 family protein n=1 Tax=Sphingomonas sp. Leaf33 TaxID=1736215 RepID=UPI0006F1FD3A|nr:DUF4169 family protein [Sphingomonas sp. Leaf33]KQN25089.1 hypothetical protein ASE86_02155 [Sphingomonas sp. Leaf33]